jgi:hypothetical protein
MKNNFTLRFICTFFCVTGCIWFLFSLFLYGFRLIKIRRFQGVRFVFTLVTVIYVRKNFYAYLIYSGSWWYMILDSVLGSFHSPVWILIALCKFSRSKELLCLLICLGSCCVWFWIPCWCRSIRQFES